VWDPISGKCLFTFKGHTDNVNCVCTLDGGVRIASGSTDDTVRVWDVEAGACVLTLKANTGNMLSVCSLVGGGRLASGNKDFAVRVWDVQTGSGAISADGSVERGGGGGTRDGKSSPQGSPRGNTSPRSGKKPAIANGKGVKSPAARPVTKAKVVG